MVSSIDFALERSMRPIDIEMPTLFSILQGVAEENVTESKQCILNSFLPDSVQMALTPLMAWAIIVIIGTIAPKSAFRSLSLTRSIEELFTSRQSRLNVLDVFRVVAIFWVMLNHTGSEGRADVLDRLPSSETWKNAVHTHPLFGALLGNSALGVEVFLVLSGLLAARSWLRSADKPFLQHYQSFIFRRVLRLIPSVAVFVYIAIGPITEMLLPRYYSTMISDCGVSGVLSHLTFFGNWQSTPTCMGYLWYLGLDMQLYVLAPFVLHILYKSPKLGVCVSTAAIIISCLIRAAYCTAYDVCNKSDVDIPFIYYPDVSRDEMAQVYAGLWDMYARPYTKCGPFLIGMLMGYATMYIKVELSSARARVLFLSGLSLAVATVYAILPEYWYPAMDSNAYNTTYTAVFRTVFALANVMMIASLYYQKESVSVSPYWTVLARLVFNAYLLHMPLIYILNYLPYLQNATNAVALLAVLPLVAVMSFTGAAIFYLFVESPLGNLSSQLAAKLGL